MLKVRLLNDGGYACMVRFKYPLSINGWYSDVSRSCVCVSGNQLGVNKDLLFFTVGTECEVVEDDC